MSDTSDDMRGSLLTHGPRGSRVRLIGREAELDALHSVLGDLRSRGGRAIAVVGEPGIGKSALMSSAVAHARALGIRVLSAYGRGAVAPGDRLCRLAAQGSPTMVALDDLHQLATDRVPGVARLIHAASTGPVLSLFAYRQRQLSPALAAELSRAASTGMLEVWSLGPLSREQAGELLGDHPDPDEVHREALGNPQYLKVIAAGGEAGADAATAILGELAVLGRTELAAVQAAAVIGEQFPPDLLAAVADLEAAEAMRALDALTRLDLVRPTEPAPQMALRHRAVGEVVYRRIEPSRRLALHRRAEVALADRAAPIARRAHHIARAADPNEPEHARILIAAARDALHAAPAVAGDSLRAAMPLLQQGEPHWHEAQVLLARARLLAGDASESRALLDALRQAPGRPPHDLSAVADASRVERRLGRYTEAGAIARSGLAALADQDTATAAALHAELSDYTYDLQDFQACLQHAATAAAIARDQHDHVGEANAMAKASLAHLFTADLAAAETATARAASLVDGTPDATVLTNLEAIYQLGQTEGMLGRLADSERHLVRGAALSLRTGQTYIQPVILMALANTRLRAGNLRRALATLDEAARNAEIRCFHAEQMLLTGDPVRAGWLLLDAAGGPDLPRLTTWRRPRWCDTLVQAALAEGDRASVEHWAQVAERCVEEVPSAGRRGFARRARMRAQVMQGQTAQAVLSAQGAIADFSAAGERIEAARTLLMVAQLSLDAGRSEEADGWLDRAAVLADQCGSARLADEVTRIRGRLAVSGGGGTGDPDTLSVLTAREREIAGLASTGMTSGEIARTLTLSVRTVESHLGRIYRKLGVSNRAGLTRTMLFPR
jgi:DNA-binding CsgD family transcriptional regulator